MEPYGMRILFCNKYNFPFSGTEVYLFELMELLRAHGHEVALFSMADPRGAPTDYDQYFVPHVDFKRNHGLISQLRLAAHAIYSRKARRRLGRMIVDFQPDVAHVRNIYHHLSPSVLWEMKAKQVPVLFHLNDFKLLCPSYNMVGAGREGSVCERCCDGEYWHVVTERCYPGPHRARLFLAAEAYVHRWVGTYDTCVDRFLAPSRFVRDKLVEHGWDRGKIAVVPHFQKLGQEIPPPAEDAPVLYFGRLSPEKGVGDLLRAMQWVPQVRLQIAGDGPLRGELETMAVELGLRNVQFLGQLAGADLERVIAQSRFTVLPSHAYETLGKTILESYACERPVVATDLGSRHELVQEGKTGLLYPVGDVIQLAKLVAFLHERPDVTRRMGRAGHELVRTRHAPEDHYKALLRVYEGLVKQKKNRAKAIPLSQPETRLRIAFIGGRGVISKYSGIEAYYEEVGRRLADMGHEVTVYCRTHFTPPLEQYNGMRLVRLPTIRSKHLETVVHTALSTLHVLTQSCDVVHYHALGPALFSFVPRLFGKKTVVTVQGLDWQRRKWGWVASAVLRLGERAAIRLPSGTIVVSRALQEHYRTRYNAETVYIPNGGTLRERRTPQTLPEWGLEPQKYVLFLGRFSPEKNCDLLVQAFEGIETDVKLTLAGGSSYSDDYASALRRSAGPRTKLLDWVSGDSLDELMTNAMLFVLPSDMEGLSLALLDAMGAGVCVLASDIAENRELVDGAGFTFHRGNRQDLERMLRLLISDQHLREKYGNAGKARIREQYLWPTIAGDIEQTYLQMMGVSAARRPAPKTVAAATETEPAAKRRAAM